MKTVILAGGLGSRLGEETNLRPKGTVNLLEAVRHSPGVRAVVCVTSDKCYENREPGQAYREDDAMGGYDPYSSSKGCAELVISAWRRSFFHPDKFGRHGVGVASARAGDVIGGGDWAKDRLVPDIYARFRGRPASADPLSQRAPAVAACSRAPGRIPVGGRKAYAGEAGLAEGWNFGPVLEDAKHVRWVADRLAQIWGDGAAWDETGEPQPHEAGHLSLDCEKARARLGWRPRWDMREGLSRAVAWYKGFAEGGAAAPSRWPKFGRTIALN